MGPFFGIKKGGVTPLPSRTGALAGSGPKPEQSLPDAMSPPDPASMSPKPPFLTAANGETAVFLALGGLGAKAIRRLFSLRSLRLMGNTHDRMADNQFQGTGINRVSLLTSVPLCGTINLSGLWPGSKNCL